jgi:hypothetical protein
MIADVSTLAGKYRSKGVFLDSNLLVLLFVGLLDPGRVRNFKRTNNQGFTEHDFSLLQKIVTAFSKVVTTPHILTETTNYICELHGELRQSALRIIAETIQSFKERQSESKKLVLTDFFIRFGLTDSAVLDLPPKKYLVLSVDAPLVIALQKKGIDAINFNHLRQQSWQQE